MAEAPQRSEPSAGTQPSTTPERRATAAAAATADPSPSAEAPSAEAPSGEVQPAEFPLRTIADAPVDDDAADRFGYRDIADGLARLIEGEETATPLTIAISAPWGAGKTSLLRLVENRVVGQRVARREAPAIVVWFNAWMHDAAPSLSAALAADIARRATACRSPWTRLWHPLPGSMLSPKERARRRFWLAVVALAVAAALYPLVAAWVGPSGTDVAKVRATFGASAVGWFVLFSGVSSLWPRVSRSVAAVAAFVDDPRCAAATGSMSEVSGQLGDLILEAREGVRQAWGVAELPRFVVIVDDLERCQPPKAVDMCEVAAQLLDHPGVITILVGDLRVIAASAELKYKDAADQFRHDVDFASEGWGRFFLQKVVQFELELPPIREERLRQLARSAPTTGAIHGRRTGTPMPPVGLRLLRSLPVWPRQGADEHHVILRPAVALALALVAPVVVLTLTWDLFSHTAGLALAGALLALAVALVVIAAVVDRTRRRIAQLREQVSGLVDNVISDVLSEPGAPEGRGAIEALAVQRVQALAESTFAGRRLWRHASSLTSPEEIRRRLQVRAAANEKLRVNAEQVILELLPPLPRPAKRLLNRLYFLLVVAYNRDLIARGGVTPQQLGKWAVLLDRWPDAARAITNDPHLLATLEKAAGNDDDPTFAAACAAHTPPLAAEPAPLRKLFRSEHKLAPAAFHLVYLDRDTPIDLSAPESAAAAADSDTRWAARAGRAAPEAQAERPA